MNAPHGICHGGPHDRELLRGLVDPARSHVAMKGGRYMRTDEHDYSTGHSLLIWQWEPSA